jgi:hypothetical protein
MIHTARCKHLYPPLPQKQHTLTRPKVCDEARDELEQWSKGAGFSVEPCSSCGT